MTVDNVIRVTSYLRDPSYAEANATTAIVAETLVSEWLVEIEVIAVAQQSRWGGDGP
jgi:2-iminobutanoate/2-iminopropanoate deaminase